MCCSLLTPLLPASSVEILSSPSPMPSPDEFENLNDGMVPLTESPGDDSSRNGSTSNRASPSKSSASAASRIPRFVGVRPKNADRSATVVGSDDLRRRSSKKTRTTPAAVRPKAIGRQFGRRRRPLPLHAGRLNRDDDRQQLLQQALLLTPRRRIP